MRYKMACTAFDKQGRDLSRDTEQLCIVRSVNGNDVGNWVEGEGGHDVFFLDARELTAQEVLRYQGRELVVDGVHLGAVDILGLNLGV